MRYPSYADYKSSRLVWLGNVPVNWDVAKFKFFIEFQEGPGIMADDFIDEGVPLLRIRNVQNSVVNMEGCNFLDADKVRKRWNQFKCKDGDLIISGSASTGLVSEVKGNSVDSIVYTGLIRLWPNGSIITKEYIKSIVASELFFTQIDLFKTGSTIQHFGPEHLNQMFITVPPVFEQEKIAAFLDYKTQQIDQLIEKKKALIGKLEEKRIAVITQAVTKGLDKNVKLKPSGVDWLTDVPEHWRIEKLKFHSRIKGGGTPDTSKFEYWDGDIPWVSPKDMKAESISKTEDYITQMGLNNSSSSLVEGNAVLVVVRSGILRHSIPVAINSIPVALNQDIKAFSFEESINGEYLLSFISGLQDHLLVSWSKPGCTVESIESDWMMNTLVTLPPIDEQEEIITYLNKARTRIDGMVSKVEGVITRLEEYRSAIITSAVTGKIDVRKVELPEAAA